MKILKKNLFYFCLLVCISVSGILFTGCSSDIEDGTTTSSQEQKIREDLIEYAEDFDVKFKLNDNISYSELTTDEIDTLKEMIKGFSSLKGTYKLVRSLNNGVYHAELKNEQLSHPLTRSSSPESASSKKYYYQDNGCILSCSYNVNWTLTDGRITSLDESGSISNENHQVYYGYSSFSTASRNYGTSVILKGTIKYKLITIEGIDLGDFTVNYSGSISGNKCDVTLS